MRTVFETMGTVASIDGAVTHSVAEQLRSLFAAAERRFSLYDNDSELSKVNRGVLPLSQASAELRGAYALALDWHLHTAGAFSPNRPDGAIDLNGVVKALCIQQAGELLRGAGLETWSVAVGGDVLCAASSQLGVWSTGIVDPIDRSRLLGAVPLGIGRRAIATSGSAERGDHIWQLDRHQRPEFVQATVVADDIVTADVLATAIISGGQQTLDLVSERWSIDALVVRCDGSLLATPGMRSPVSA